MLGSFWGHFGVSLGSLWMPVWDHFGVVLASLWGRFGITLGTLWDDFGVMVASLQSKLIKNSARRSPLQGFLKISLKIRRPSVGVFVARPGGEVYLPIPPSAGPCFRPPRKSLVTSLETLKPSRISSLSLQNPRTLTTGPPEGSFIWESRVLASRFRCLAPRFRGQASVF